MRSSLAPNRGARWAPWLSSTAARPSVSAPVSEARPSARARRPASGAAMTTSSRRPAPGAGGGALDRDLDGMVVLLRSGGGAGWLDVGGGDAGGGGQPGTGPVRLGRRHVGVGPRRQRGVGGPGGEAPD